MHYRISIAAFATLAGCAALVGRLTAATETTPSYSPGETSDQAPGPSGQRNASGGDLIVGDLTGPFNWGSFGSTAAYSLGITWCNIGDRTLSWAPSPASNQHQVGCGGIYRFKTVGGATRFEQIGMSWCKHGVCAFQQTLCGVCTSCGGGCPPCLGVGCSNPYTSQAVGMQSQLGPRYEINASTGSFPAPYAFQGLTGDVIYKRLQVKNADLDPIFNPGAVYFGETITIHPQDAAAGHGANNASHRRLTVGAFTGTLWPLAFTGSTIRELPAIHAWKTLDPAVTIQNLDVPGDGRYVVAHKATDIGDGWWHYEYAIYNVSSHRSGQSFSVPLGPGVSVSNLGFRGPPYHSGDKPDNVPWPISVADGQVTWATQPYSGAAPSGNEWTAYALRWGTMYTFRFDADAPPRLSNATLGLFRPGSPQAMSVALTAPAHPAPCAADFDSSGVVDGMDLATLLAAWGQCPPGGPCPADLNHDGIVSGLDLASTLAQWGPC